MIIQTAGRRPIINPHAMRQHILVLSLAREGTSTGALSVSVSESHTDPLPVPWTRSLPLDIPGLTVIEFVLPFQDLSERLSAGGRTTGYYFRSRSAVRRSAREYAEVSTEFHVIFPSSGGGVVRVGLFDISNPELNPRAEFPPIGLDWGTYDGESNFRIPDEIIITAFQRAHLGGSPSQVARAAAAHLHRLGSFALTPVEQAEEQAVELYCPQSPLTMVPRPDPTSRYTRALGLDL